MKNDPRKLDAPDLGWALSRTLRAPLDGLRASMETLAGNLRHESVDGRGAARTLDAALEQVQRIARDVEALIAYARPRPVAPLRCSVDELLQTTLLALPPDLRTRVRVTCPAPGYTTHVDGPLLAGCLARLLESSLHSSRESDWVLLEVRPVAGEVQFRIFDGGAGSILGPVVEREDTPRGAHLGLGESLARRDLERMGVTMTLERVHEVQHLVVHVPERTECVR
jgi:K+-sensing histidine kinase KdpD